VIPKHQLNLSKNKALPNDNDANITVQQSIKPAIVKASFISSQDNQSNER